MIDKPPSSRAERQTMNLKSKIKRSMEIRKLRAELRQFETFSREKATVAKECYQSAVVAYAEACAPLLALAQDIRDCALDAGVHITPGNSPGLVGVHIQIGGALIDIRK